MGVRPLLAAVAALCIAALAAALVSQHVYDMQPCPWCVLQRLVFALIAVIALGALGALGARAGTYSRPGIARAAAAGIGVLALVGMGTALWQHFVAASSVSCNLTLADRIMSATGLDMLWPEVFAAYASCADAKVNLLGVPYEFWSLALYAGMAALAAMAFRAGRLAHR